MRDSVGGNLGLYGTFDVDAELVPSSDPDKQPYSATTIGHVVQLKATRFQSIG